MVVVLNPEMSRKKILVLLQLCPILLIYTCHFKPVASSVEHKRRYWTTFYIYLYTGPSQKISIL